MATWITADLHLSHYKVTELRGFSNIDEHDSTVMHNLLSKVRTEDQVFLLGDITFGPPEKKMKNLQMLSGELKDSDVYIILGNHDRPAMKNGHKHIATWSNLFTGVVHFAQSYGFMLSHYPYAGDHTREDRFNQFRLKDLGKPLLHGHTHSDQKFSLSPLGTPQIHVGLDAWNMQPVSMGEATAVLKEKK